MQAAGSKVPINILSRITSIALGKPGENLVVLCCDSIVIFNPDCKKVAEIDESAVSCIAVDVDNNILAFSAFEIKRFDMTGHELPSARLMQLFNPRAVATGNEGQLYVVEPW